MTNPRWLPPQHSGGCLCHKATLAWGEGREGKQHGDPSKATPKVLLIPVLKSIKSPKTL